MSNTDLPFQSNVIDHQTHFDHLSGQDSVYALVMSKEVGQPVGPRLGSIAAPSFPFHSSRLWPALQLELDAFGYPGHVIPVFYNESTEAKWIFTQLNADNQVTNLQVSNRTIDWVKPLFDILTEELDEETLEIIGDLSGLKFQIQQLEGDFHSRYPDGVPEDSHDLDGIYDELDQRYYPLEGINGSYFGSVPLPVQSNFAIPSYKGKPMQFVGQVSFSEAFKLINYHVYLFYDPENRIVAQALAFT